MIKREMSNLSITPHVLLSVLDKINATNVIVIRQVYLVWDITNIPDCTNALYDELTHAKDDDVAITGI